MGYLKQDAILVNCDNVCEIETGISSNDLTVKLSWPVNSSTNVLKGTLTFTKGGSNSFTKSAAQYGAIFADAIALGGGIVSGSIAIPVVEEEVTATGAAVGAIAPSFAVAFAAP
jgi:hypothetical protein